MVYLLQLTAARLVIDHTVQQVTGQAGVGDTLQVSKAGCKVFCAAHEKHLRGLADMMTGYYP